MDEWLQREMMRCSMSRETSHALIKGVLPEKSIRELMEELRAEDPEAAMLLGEYIVVEDDEA